MTDDSALVDRILKWVAWVSLAVAIAVHFVARGSTDAAGSALLVTIICGGAYATRRANRGEPGLSGRFFDQRKEIARDLAERRQADSSRDR